MWLCVRKETFIPNPNSLPLEKIFHVGMYPPFPCPVLQVTSHQKFCRIPRYDRRYRWLFHEKIKIECPIVVNAGFSGSDGWFQWIWWMVSVDLMDGCGWRHTYTQKAPNCLGRVDSQRWWREIFDVRLGGILLGPWSIGSSKSWRVPRSWHWLTSHSGGMTTESKLDEKILGKENFNFKNCGMTCATKNHLSAFGMLWKRINRLGKRWRVGVSFGWVLLDEVSCCFMATFYNIFQMYMNGSGMRREDWFRLAHPKNSRSHFLACWPLSKLAPLWRMLKQKDVRYQGRWEEMMRKGSCCMGTCFVVFLLGGLQLDGVTRMTCFLVFLTPSKLRSFHYVSQPHGSKISLMESHFEIILIP